MKTRKPDAWRDNPKLAGCFSEIERFGGQPQVEATVRALSDMKSAIAQNVASTPDAFDANQRPESQEQATDSIITFLVYGLLAAIALTIFIPMIFSPKPGRFGWGIGGLLATVGIGVAIFLRIRN